MKKKRQWKKESGVPDLLSRSYQSITTGARHGKARHEREMQDDVGTDNGARRDDAERGRAASLLAALLAAVVLVLVLVATLLRGSGAGGSACGARR